MGFSDVIFSHDWDKSTPIHSQLREQNGTNFSPKMGFYFPNI